MLGWVCAGQQGDVRTPVAGYCERQAAVAPVQAAVRRSAVQSGVSYLLGLFLGSHSTYRASGLGAGG